MKLYNLVLKEDGSASVDTDLTPEDMLTLLTVGFYACLERGVMVKSLAGFFGQPDPKEPVTIDQVPDNYQDYLDVPEEENEKENNDKS